MNKEMDPLMAASNVYKLLNENDRVRVLEVVSKPGDIAKMHHHPNHVLYALKGVYSLSFLFGSFLYLARASNDKHN